MIGLSRIGAVGARRFSTTSVGSSAATSSTSSIAVSEAHPHVFHVRLNRPEKRNAFTLSLWKEMKSVFDGLAAEPKCRVIVISGEGKSFCGGIDLREGMGEIITLLQDDSVDVGRKARAVRNILTICQDGFTAIEKCPKPVIAAVHSHCIGAGVDLITACDVRFASRDAVFSIKEVDIGLAADVGTLNRIEKIVGSASWVRELAFTARDCGADEARQQGLVSRVYETEKEVKEASLDVARRIAEKSPIAVQGTKETLVYSRDHTVADALNFVKTWNMSQLLSSDLVESAMAAMSKQTVEFKDV